MGKEKQEGIKMQVNQTKETFSHLAKRENKKLFVEKYLKPLVCALDIGVINAVYRKTDDHNEIVTLIYSDGYTIDKDVTAGSLSALTLDVVKGL